jgi:hypothetical protein
MTGTTGVEDTFAKREKELGAMDEGRGGAQDFELTGGGCGSSQSQSSASESTMVSVYVPFGAAKHAASPAASEVWEQVVP